LLHVTDALWGQNRVYEVAKHTTVRVVCKVDANPSLNFAFKWQFNTSVNTVNLLDEDVSIEGSSSVALYTPKTELDYGSLACWATNSVGLGSPCIFHILPVGPPDPPLNRTASNVSYSSLTISCHGKYNNPVPHFTLEVSLSKTGKSIVLQKSNNLTFKVIDLKPGSMYTANVKAVNKFGKSDALFISFATQAEPVKTIAETKVKEERNDENEVIGIILGIVVTSVIM